MQRKCDMLYLGLCRGLWKHINVLVFEGKHDINSLISTAVEDSSLCNCDFILCFIGFSKF